MDSTSLAPFRRGYAQLRRRLTLGGALLVPLVALIAFLDWTWKTQLAIAVLGVVVVALWGYALLLPGRKRALAALSRPETIAGFAHHGVVVNGVTSVHVYVLTTDGAELVIPVRHADLAAALATLRRVAPHATEKRV